ncbi:phytoene dehydrogenase-like protein [Saccharopolyspora lacisalsi]|uniref:Phytoene dehydrogenase-like protein n=1 Tax=Halosaccharopolyspora lacisalsi TaxID=1000566 RepID=A0A839E002_9PSEU|nr:NAD(P)/FAD-dependent oxidoreductase [Halosaccharopolyspora lacisalsi]MBA8827522.1 phytoene dehydrogenase-like protein [Halosaccharopolyspora lacisalsi]
MTSVDAVVVGSGPNGLTAAVTLAEAGLSVQLHEAAPEIGGGARTEQLTLPGFHHDPCSAVHPLGAGSPALSRLPLERFGLEWLYPEVDLAHPLPDGSAVELTRGVERTAELMGADAATYRRVVRGFPERWDSLATNFFRAPLHGLPPDPLLLARFGLRAAWPAGALMRLFREERSRALLAGLAAHVNTPLSSVGTGGVALMFALAAHAVGWPVPRGGSQAITNALAGYLGELGGTIVTGHRVSDLAELPSASAYLLDVAPRELAGIAGSRLPARYLHRLGRYRYGPGVFKVDYALSGPVPWSNPSCRRATTVHIGPSSAEIGAALTAASRGRRPSTPFLITSQPGVLDDSRAPAGEQVFWVYAHVPHGWDGDLTAEIEAQLERFAPGFGDLVLARTVRGPAELEAHNPNYVGGDIACGSFSGTQTLFRPVIAANPYTTPDPAVYLCSSATPPGPGVHGMCGYHAARAALHNRFGTSLT